MTSEDSNDCLSCRLVSAGGLFLASIYVYRQSSNKTRFNRYGMLLISAGFGLVGTARLFNLIPLGKQQTRVNKENGKS